MLRDLGSGNGTYSNGRRVEGSAALNRATRSTRKASLFFDHGPVEPVGEVPPAPRSTSRPSDSTMVRPLDEIH
ncbi:MAG TPA: hypothetical protein VLF19_02915 [Methylomirabilota bacterium]|nr:hypothetical protein [Methylomirabilota bacterium]